MLIERANHPVEISNGVYHRYQFPVLTAAHVPLDWRYDFDRRSNPFLMERFGINAVLNAGAIKWNGKYLLMARVEGADRKSFFAIAESENGTDCFSVSGYSRSDAGNKKSPTQIFMISGWYITKTDDLWTVLYRKKAPGVPASDQSSAIAQYGIARTKDLDLGT